MDPMQSSPLGFGPHRPPRLPLTLNSASLSPDPIQLGNPMVSQPPGSARGPVRKVSLSRLPGPRPSVELASPASHRCGQQPSFARPFSNHQLIDQNCRGLGMSAGYRARDSAISPDQQVRGGSVHTPQRLLPVTPGAMVRLSDRSLAHSSHISSFKRPGLAPTEVTSQQTQLPREKPSRMHCPPSLAPPMKIQEALRQHLVRGSPRVSGDLSLPSKGFPPSSIHTSRGKSNEKYERHVVSGPPQDSCTTVPRPLSQSSNISRRRMNPGRLSFPFHGDEMVDLEKFGSAWNTYLQNHARRSENAAHRMSELEKIIDDKNKCIREHTENFKKQSSLVSSLESRVAELSGQNELLVKANNEVRVELEQFENLRKDMQIKIKSYRTKLNEAIVEQQSLYKRCKASCDNTIDSIRKEQEETQSQQRKALEQFEIGMKKAAAARDAIKLLLEEELRASKTHGNKRKLSAFTFISSILTKY